MAVIEEYRAAHAAPERVPEDSELPGTEAERATVALAKHLRGRPIPTDRKAVQRIGTYLIRRGFDADTVRATIRAAEHAAPIDEPEE
jgi:SOS response regulatory protein OraA/RecX